MWFQTKIKLLGDGAVNLHFFPVVAEGIPVFIQFIKNFRNLQRGKSSKHVIAMHSFKRNHNTHLHNIAFPRSLQ